MGKTGNSIAFKISSKLWAIKVFSKTKDSDWYSVYVEVALKPDGGPDPENQKDISKPKKEDIPKEFKKLVGDKSGTLVIWSNNDTNEIRASEVVEETKIWAGRTYRKFIWKNINLLINGEEIHAIDPLYVKTTKTRFPKVSRTKFAVNMWNTLISQNFDPFGRKK